jgi:hypothetical protein
MENSFNLNVPKIELPNANVVLALGILSIVGCCCYGVVGLVCAIIALVLAKTATNLYVSNPEKFTESSYSNLNAGKICAWVGLIPSIICVIMILWIIIFLGVAALTDPSIFFNRFGIEPPF